MSRAGGVNRCGLGVRRGSEDTPSEQQPGGVGIGGRKGGRFNHLVMEEGEFLVAVHSCVVIEPEETYKASVLLCSRSIIVDASDHHRPLLKIGFRHCGRVAAWTGVVGSHVFMADDNVLLVEASEWSSCKVDGKIGAYDSVKGDLALHLRLHTPIVPFVETADKFREFVDKLPEQRATLRASWILEDMHRAFKLDMSTLERAGETAHGDAVLVMAVEPMLESAGLLVVTNRCLRFQEVHPLCTRQPGQLRLADIKRVLPRRYSLRQIGLEVFVRSTGDSHLFAFKSPKERDDMLQRIVGHEACARSLDANDPANMTVKWQSGLVSNFDYLMFLNELADRSFNDLTQYPVFPWVLTDYHSDSLNLSDPKVYRDLSKPVGALNPTRLADFLYRFREMEGEPNAFMYGTHYSTPGFVLYWLIRRAPEYMLKLHRGRFDVADRLFHSVSRAWDSAWDNTADVKELIPEFYSPGAESFLVNSAGLDLGERHDGSVVGDVQLPPWAKGDATRFVETMREALESDHVSRNLHLWIDLIFGCKQRGEAAVQACNLFYYLTYEGAVDLEEENDPIIRSALQAQIQEFGQTPKQLFVEPHPQKFVVDELEPSIPSSANNRPGEIGIDSLANRGPVGRERDVDDARIHGLRPGDHKNHTQDEVDAGSSSMGRRSFVLEGSASTNGAGEHRMDGRRGGGGVWWDEDVLRRLRPCRRRSSTRAHRSGLTGLAASSLREASGAATVYSVGQDGLLKLHAVERGGQVMRQLRSFAVGSLALSTVAVLAEGGGDRQVVLGSWDNHIYVFDVEYGRVQQKLLGHDEAVSCLRCDLNTGTVVSGSWDSSVKFWQRRASGFDSAPLNDFYDPHTDVVCLDAQLQRGLAVAGCDDGELLLFDVRSKRCVHRMPAHQGGVGAVAMSRCGRRLVTCGVDDGRVCVFEMGGGLLMDMTLDSGSLRALVSDGRHIMVGDAAGVVRCMNVDDTEGLSVVWEHPVHDAAVTALANGSSGATLLSGSDDGTIAALEPGDVNETRVTGAARAGENTEMFEDKGSRVWPKPYAASATSKSIPGGSRKMGSGRPGVGTVERVGGSTFGELAEDTFAASTAERPITAGSTQHGRMRSSPGPRRAVIRQTADFAAWESDGGRRPTKVSLETRLSRLSHNDEDDNPWG